MKKVRNLIIGGIQSKVFNLILFTVILLTAAGIVLFLNQNYMLSEVVSETSKKQQETITEITSAVMDQEISQALERANGYESRIANGMFEATGERIAFLADCLTRILANPGDYAPKSFSGPDQARDGEWKMKVIYADGVDRENPDINATVGLAANLEETIISLCRAYGASNAYIALPEGVHLSVSDSASSWFGDGVPRSYDPRTRGWYQQAEREGKLIYTEGEYDATTGVYCIECAAPVYGPDGSLRAVIGTDMFLNEIEAVMQESQIEGEYQLLINQGGHAVLAPQEAKFPMAEDEWGRDLRESGSELLRKVVGEALQGRNPGVLKGELKGMACYITAMPIEATGWTLIAAYKQDTAAQYVTMLQERNRQIQAEASAQYREKREQFKVSTIILLVAIAAVMLAGSLIISGRIVKPLNTITRRISELKEGNLEFRMEDTYRTGDEVEELAQSFATLSHKTVEYVETVKRVSADNERISTELSLATKIQSSMLPHIVPAFPDRKEFDVLGSMDPAREVGGDFYDYFLIDPDHLGMVIADVSGKGIPAALFMMASKIILQSVAMLGRSAGEILTKTNEAICSNNEMEMFITVWVGILEISTGKLTAANAGHEYPVLMRANGDVELYKDRHGFVIGGMTGIKYREYEMQLNPGDKLFLYTDGVPEATDAEKELFGTERMLAALNEGKDGSPEQVLESVRRAVDDFVKNEEQFDDMTMLCLAYKGPAMADSNT